ncbi:MAG TPA: ABC transporter permease, partial [Thermoanaerobaculia bacterium]
MTAPWKKALRDFWQERTRTLLVVMAIAMGIAGFSTVMSTYAILTRELDRGYLATNPASATLWTDDVDGALIARVLAMPAVGAAEARREVRARVRVAPMVWRNARLFVVEDYADIRVSVLKPQSGAWPPKTGEILIERDAMQVAKTKIGSTLALKTDAGDEHALRVTGIVHDVGQAQARMENSVYGYVNLATLAQLGEEPRLDQLKIVVADHRFDEQHVRRVTAGVQALLESEGHPVRRVEVPVPGKHPHGDLMGMLLLAKASFGAFVLLLSGVIVVNLLMALMAAQVPQIGVMKTLGATRAQIARIYLGQALLLGLAAIAIGIPFGMWGSRIFCRAMAAFLNFDIASFAVPAWVYALDVAIGLVVPLLAAAYPVWRGSGVSIREALADYGVSRTSFGSNRFDRVITGVGGMGRPLLLAIRNSFRRRTRLVLTLLTLAAGGAFFMTALNVRASLIRTLDGLFAQRNHDLSVTLGTMAERERVERAVRNTRGIRAFEGWITSQGSFGDAPSPAPAAAGRHAAHAGDGFPIVVLPATTKMWRPAIAEGRALRAGESDALVVNSALAAKYPQLKAGSTVSFQMGPAMTTWEVVGITREPFSPGVAYAPMQFFDERHPGVVNNLRLQLDRTDAGSIDRVKSALEQNLAREGLRAISSTSNADSRYGFDAHMLMLYVSLV